MLKHIKQLTSDSLIYGIADAVSKLLSIFIVPITTRIFSPHDYGVMSLVMSTNSLLTLAMVLALDAATYRWFYDTEDEADRKRTFASWAWCQMGVSLLLAMSLIALSGTAGRRIVGSDSADIYFIQIAIALPLIGPGFVLIRWLRCFRRAWMTVAYTLSYMLLNIGLTLLFVVVLRMGVLGLLWAHVITSGFRCLFAVALMRDWLHPRHVQIPRLKEMLAYSSPLIPASIAQWILAMADRYILQYFGTTAEVGLYSVGTSISAFSALAVTAFTQAWTPFALSIHKREEAPRVYNAAFLGYTWVACITAAAVTILAPEALRILTSPPYYGAAAVVGLLSFAWVMDGYMYVALIGSSIAKETKPAALAVTVAAAATVLLNVLLIPRFGILGAAAASAIAFSIRAGYLFYQSNKLFPIPYRFRPAAAMIVFTGIVMWIGQHLHTGSIWVNILVKLALLASFVPALFILRLVRVDQVMRAFGKRR